MQDGVITEADIHAQAGLEHADPKDQIASMRSHEAEVMRLIGEIEAKLSEVQA